MQPIRLQFVLTQKEVQNVYWTHLKKKGLKTKCIQCAIFLLLGIYFLVTYLNEPTWGDGKVLCIICFLFALLVAAVPAYQCISKAKRVAGENIQRYIQFDEQSFLFGEANGGEQTVLYDSAYYVLQDDTQFYIVFENQTIFALPKRVMNPKQVEQVQALFAKHQKLSQR